LENYKKFIYCLIALMLLTSFLHIQETEAARTPNLIVVKVSPNNYESFNEYHKYVPGYCVDIANYGSAASKATTIDMYIRTYEGKTLKKSFPIKAINAGKIIRVKFSMSRGTDGSLKDGYVIVNPKKSFKEISYKDNLKKFGLKDVMLKNSTKNVTEYYATASNVAWIGTTSSYNSPLSNNTGINKLSCQLNFNLRYLEIAYIEADIPGYMHENVTMKIYGSSTYQGTPTSWNDTTCRYDFNRYMSTFSYAYFEVRGNNLETKNAFKEPIKVVKRYWDPYAQVWNYTDISTGYIRNIKEYYPSYVYNSKSYTYTTATSYTVHNSNVYKLQVTGDPRGYYCAGWFINPSATSISKVTGVYGNELQNMRTGSKINSNTWGVSQKIRDIHRIGLIIEGNNIKGFLNFKTLGFNSWTWKELY